ncbi:MAG TPA: glycosyltransferase family 2 protein [Bacteroidota bacterium]|jgi:glycosyltransferase involved in cell wall biosynthesis|nr:glycosyltransferase family 2 protein [Bacteroidota bacterium]
MAKISAVVITFNEERNIERCLKSLRWVDEIIVVDSFSTDRTIVLAKSCADNILILQHVYDGDIPQRERGFAVAGGEWLLYVDADEEVSEELQHEILEVINDPVAEKGYFIPRKVSILGRWIMHGGWHPDRSFRLFRKSAYVAVPAEVHGGFEVRGATGRLSGELYHYTYSSLEEYLRKMNIYTSLQVSNKLREDPRRGAGIRKVVLSPPAHFIKKFFFQQGYKDGILGFILAIFGSLYTLALYAKLWEYQMQSRRAGGMLPPVTNLDLVEHRRRLP